jgi:PLD-like domain
VQTIHGAKLGMTLRQLSDSARSRVWIVSPYIGRWPAVSALLGGNWWLGTMLDLRVITDISEPRNANRGTLLHFIDRGTVKSIPGVHAKVYIFDSYVLLTSANLTETAFTKRREIGTLLNEQESADAIQIFETWWKLADDLNEATLAELEKSVSTEVFPESDGAGLPALWSLPSRPASEQFAGSGESERTSNYRQFLKNYREIASLYESVQRVWPEAPLFLEVDAFLNYLFHEAGDRPSFAYWGNVPKSKMDADDRLHEITTRAPEFARWCAEHSDEESDRMDRLITVQKLLQRDRIFELSWEDARSVADRLHAMGARQLNKYKFLNGKDNSIETIRLAWTDLLFGRDSEDRRIRSCDEQLRFFGMSSIQELLGCFYPDQYPLRNSNSDSGLKFLGFDV